MNCRVSETNVTTIQLYPFSQIRLSTNRSYSFANRLNTTGCHHMVFYTQNRFSPIDIKKLVLT